MATGHARTKKKTVEIPSFGVREKKNVERALCVMEEGSENELSGEEKEEWLCCRATEPRTRLMAAQRGTCQLRGQWRKKTLTPNYRPHAHRAHADMLCQLHHGFFFFCFCHRQLDIMQVRAAAQMLDYSFLLLLLLFCLAVFQRRR